MCACVCVRVCMVCVYVCVCACVCVRVCMVCVHLYVCVCACVCVCVCVYGVCACVDLCKRTPECIRMSRLCTRLTPARMCATEEETWDGTAKKKTHTPYTHAHIHTHTYTRTHTHAHTRIYTRTHTRTHTCAHPQYMEWKWSYHAEAFFAFIVAFVEARDLLIST